MYDPLNPESATGKITRFESKKDVEEFRKVSKEQYNYSLAIAAAVGGGPAGMLLCQLHYWHMNGANGQPRLRVYRDGHYWVAKTREEWCHEVGITLHQYWGAIERLKALGVIDITYHTYAGAKRTTHIRILWDRFLELLNEHIERTSKSNGPKGPNILESNGGKSPNTSESSARKPCNTGEVSQQNRASITETYTETSSIPSSSEGEIINTKPKNPHLEKNSNKSRENAVEQDESSVPPKDNKKVSQEEVFDLFMKVYPRKGGIEGAWRAWSRLRPSVELAKKMAFDVAERVRRFEDWVKDGGKWIPSAKKYIEERLWEKKWEKMGAFKGM